MSFSMSISNNCRLYIHTKRHGLVQRHATTRKNILAGIFALLYTCRLCESTLVDLCADAWKMAGQSEQQALISLSLSHTYAHTQTHTHTHTHAGQISLRVASFCVTDSPALPLWMGVEPFRIIESKLPCHKSYLTSLTVNDDT
jgi:hypothetical protein